MTLVKISFCCILSDSNRIRTHNHLVGKRTLNLLAKLTQWLNCVVSTYLYCTWLNNNIKSNVLYRYVLTTQPNHLASLAKWLRICLRIKWLWVQIPLLSLKLQIWCLLRARSSLTFRQTMKCTFTLKPVRDMIITYSHITAVLKTVYK